MWNLGFISRERRREIFSDFHTTSLTLPKIFSGASARLYSISSSLSAIVVCFLVEESFQTCYEDVLKSHLLTQLRPKGRTVTSIWGPDHLKMERVKQIRSAIRGSIQDWLGATAPGAFSSSKSGHIPCIEFVEISKNPHRRGWRAIQRFFYNESSFDSWKSGEEDGLEFHEKVPTFDTEHSYGSITASPESLRALDLKHYGGWSNDALGYRLDLSLNGFMIPWGCLQLMASFGREVAAARDTYFDPVTYRVNRSRYAKVRERWQRSIDIASITYELNGKEARWALRADAPNFVNRSPRGDEPPRSFTETAVKQIERISKDLSFRLKITTDVQREADSSFALVQSGVVSRITVWMSILSSVVALFALVVGLLSLILSWSVATQDQVDKIRKVVELFPIL